MSYRPTQMRDFTAFMGGQTLCELCSHVTRTLHIIRKML